MSNRWICNVVMIVPVDLAEDAALVASSMSGNPLDNTPAFFSRQVRTIIGGLVTHKLSHSRMREAVLDQLPSILTMFAGAAYHVTDHDEDDSAKMTVEEWLETLGLELLEEEE